MTYKALVDELMEAARTLLLGLEGSINLAFKLYTSALKLVKQLVDAQLAMLEELGAEEARREKVKVE